MQKPVVVHLGKYNKQNLQLVKMVQVDPSAGAVIGLSAAAGEGGAGGLGGAGVVMSETRNADGREMGDGVLTQSSAAGGASEWSFL
ncbi:hypothetical protein Tco_0025819 [Tanacetum coccineum]